MLCTHPLLFGELDGAAICLRCGVRPVPKKTHAYEDIFSPDGKRVRIECRPVNTNSKEQP
jgi:hypothetical protein